MAASAEAELPKIRIINIHRCRGPKEEEETKEVDGEQVTVIRGGDAINIEGTAAYVREDPGVEVVETVDAYTRCWDDNGRMMGLKPKWFEDPSVTPVFQCPGPIGPQTVVRIMELADKMKVSLKNACFHVPTWNLETKPEMLGYLDRIKERAVADNIHVTILPQCTVNSDTAGEYQRVCDDHIKIDRSNIGVGHNLNPEESFRAGQEIRDALKTNRQLTPEQLSNFAFMYVEKGDVDEMVEDLPLEAKCVVVVPPRPRKGETPDDAVTRTIGAVKEKCPGALVLTKSDFEEKLAAASIEGQNSVDAALFLAMHSKLEPSALIGCGSTTVTTEAANLCEEKAFHFTDKNKKDPNSILSQYLVEGELPSTQLVAPKQADAVVAMVQRSKNPDHSLAGTTEAAAAGMAAAMSQ